ncbi:hypothetical protein DPMN_085430 [Dreissena polymorpha]|uniref:Uncharacterized protein n=1 Tax=Dreissena polymorpha TaxID=45954 RepID=A0A9D3YCF0_DREPO|nr:hypothetical protein DPMN_085430 [Dreissena polymorpha]
MLGTGTKPTCMWVVTFIQSDGVFHWALKEAGLSLEGMSPLCCSRSRISTNKSAGLEIYPSYALDRPKRESIELGRDIVETTILIEFHEDVTINAASRVFSRYFIEANVLTNLNSAEVSLLGTNILIKFREDL